MSLGAEIEILDVELAGESCRTRLPFRFGIVTLTEAPVILARVTARIEGETIVGYSADLCVPKWFEKNPDKSTRDDILTLFASARRAALAAKGRSGMPFAIWHHVYRRCVEGDLACGVRLVDGFGTALVERAMIDAVCRGLGRSFRQALLDDAFGLDPSAILPSLPALSGSDLVVAKAPSHVLVRHTVGGLDALRAADVPEPLRGDDDHPVSLEEDIDRFGLRAFKLKAGGDPAADTRRLAEIARVVSEGGVSDPVYSLDANESYEDVAAVHRLLDALEQDPDGQRILEGLSYLEQPLPRNRTLSPEAGTEIEALARRVPLLIDEADDSIEAFSQALELGYRGVSVKNCKGVFRALTNRALCVAYGDGAFQTSEDLTNLPVLPLQQDLTTLAALGLEHSERNGHHFFPGLDVVPVAEAESALARHPELYERRGEQIVLRIEDGRIALACQDSTGYGYASEIDYEARRSLDALSEELFA